MRKLLCALFLVVLNLPVQLSAQSLLYDDFLGNVLDKNKWHIPTWVSSTDGTYVGRTQFRCTQNSGLPRVQNGAVLIALDTYNPTGYSFYGTDLISNKSFLPNASKGIHIIVRARMNTTQQGIVGGIFLYALKPGSNTVHDEIDFEILTNRPNEVHTNVYDSEPLGVGHPVFVLYKSGTIIDYHVYEIKWEKNRVRWYVDGKQIRSETTHVPSGPMYLHLNIWAPDIDWSEAYDKGLQPTRFAHLNERYTMSVDMVEVKYYDPATYMPFIPLLLNN